MSLMPVDKQLDLYTKADAYCFCDALIARGLASSSLTRFFGTVRAVTNFGTSEQGLKEGSQSPDQTCGPSGGLWRHRPQCRDLLVDHAHRGMITHIGNTNERHTE
jgi:hypothetical protein